MSVPSAGVWQILGPKRITARRRLGRQSSGSGKATSILVVGALFWLAAYGILYRILRYFQGVEDIGDLLAAKLLSMILLTFLSVLLLSNVITALSTFFLSRDLELLMSAPTESAQLYMTKLTETVLHSSWMVALMCVPILVAYGTVYGGSIELVLVSIAALVPFFLIISVVGSAITLLLVSIFPARRAKDIFGVITVAAAAPRTPMSRPKMNTGSRIIFTIIPRDMMNMGRMVSPSPARIPRKKAERTEKVNPQQIIRK